MTQYFYIDTCSLKWRYLPGNPTADVVRIMDDPNNKVYTSELTVLEWSSALGQACRESKISYPDFKRNELALMTDIANAKLSIFPINRSIERARYLIEYVSVLQGRNLRTGDALHLVTARELAYSVRNVVSFVTCDKKLSDIVFDLDIFKPSLQAVFIRP